MWVRHPNIIKPTLVAQKTPHGDRMDEQYKVGIYEPKVKPVRSKIKPKSRVSAPLSWFRQLRLYAPINPNYRCLSIPVAMFTWRPPHTFSTSDPHKMAETLTVYNREAQGLSHADHWSVVVSWPCHARNWSKAWYTVHVTGSRREIVNNTVIQHVKTTQLDAPPTSKLCSTVNIPNKQTCHMCVWHDMWKYLHVYMPRQHTLLCAIPTAVCQWTVNVVNCQNVRPRRCKQTLFTLLLVSNATPIENITIQFVHKNTPNATVPSHTTMEIYVLITMTYHFSNIVLMELW